MKRLNGVLPSIFFLLTFLIILSCAKIELPPGGPPDETPPEVIASEPSKGATSVPLDADVRITFSEKMKKVDVVSQIVIIPEPEEPPRLDWDGDQLVIEFRDILEDNRTYLVTIKTGMEDLRRNKLERPFMLAFSTGEKLDNGIVRGQVFENFKPANAVDIWAYDYDNNNGFDIFERKPDYIGQSDSLGRYSLEYMAYGQYLVFAAQDRAGNRIYDPLSDKIAIPYQTIELDSFNAIMGRFDLMLSDQDTASLRIVSAKFNQDRLIEINLSSRIMIDSISPENIAILKDTLEAGEYDIRIYAPSDSSTTLLLAVDGLANGECMIRLSGIDNIRGRGFAGGSDTVRVMIEDLADETAPEIVGTWPDIGSRFVAIDTEIRAYFSEPIQLDSADSSAIYLVDKDSSYIVEGELLVEGMEVRYVPSDTLKADAEYVIYLDPRRIHDRAGNYVEGDSVETINFRTLDRSEYGSISGRLEVDDAMDDRVLVVSSVDRTMEEKVILDDSLYFYVVVPDGKYFFYTFLDVNDNGNLDSGALKPFRYAERFHIFPDTIPVRARFETEDVVLDLP